MAPVSCAHSPALDKTCGRSSKWPTTCAWQSLAFGRPTPRSRTFLLVSLTSWGVFLLPFGFLSLITYEPNPVVEQQRGMAARQIGAGWLRSNPLVR